MSTWKNENQPQKQRRVNNPSSDFHASQQARFRKWRKCAELWVAGTTVTQPLPDQLSRVAARCASKRRLFKFPQEAVSCPRRNMEFEFPVPFRSSFSERVKQYVTERKA
ncbi:hypothetical protein AVEN_158535-1, partial [Araneus ventricosus]